MKIWFIWSYFIQSMRTLMWSRMLCWSLKLTVYICFYFTLQRYRASKERIWSCATKTSSRTWQTTHGNNQQSWLQTTLPICASTGKLKFPWWLNKYKESFRKGKGVIVRFCFWPQHTRSLCVWLFLRKPRISCTNKWILLLKW